MSASCLCRVVNPAIWIVCRALACNSDLIRRDMLSDGLIADAARAVQPLATDAHGVQLNVQALGTLRALAMQRNGLDTTVARSMVDADVVGIATAALRHSAVMRVVTPGGLVDEVLDQATALLCNLSVTALPVVEMLRPTTDCLTAVAEAVAAPATTQVCENVAGLCYNIACAGALRAEAASDVASHGVMAHRIVGVAVHCMSRFPGNAHVVRNTCGALATMLCSAVVAAAAADACVEYRAVELLQRAVGDDASLQRHAGDVLRSLNMPS